MNSSLVLLSRRGKHSWTLSAKLGSIELAIGKVCTISVLPPVSLSDCFILAVPIGLETRRALTVSIAA